ncbi:inorganic triphosphatase [Thalassotalea euphylliae]|uniref:CYTH domain-containing protein n=1 Tax=Thalassotalea euphylliae TaxID=1655234 RepID=UPI00364582CF
MSTEIELKYLVADLDVADRFTALLTDKQLLHTHTTRHLSNTYFDTQARSLRSFDMGLRVRRVGDYTEQTIKTAGTTIGGLHQRPEYNVEIDDTFPTLSLFPSEIWPENASVEDLQKELVSVFSTNFTRECWQVIIGDSEIEVAYDHGKIESQGQTLDINEIELELVKGERDAIFTLAELLIDRFNVTAGTESKAARGYKLWQQGLVEEDESTQESQTFSDSLDNRDIEQVSLSASLSVEKAMLIGLEQGLRSLQQAIASTIQTPTLPNLKCVFQALTFIDHGFSLHQELIEQDKFDRFTSLVKESMESFSWLESAIHINDLTLRSGHYRKKLEYSNQLVSTLKLERSRFPNEQEIKQLLSGKVINLLQLKLLKFILSPVVKPSEKPRVIEDFSRSNLEKSLKALVSISGNKHELDSLEFIVMQHHLYSSLLTGSWYGSLFNGELRAEYRRQWLDVFYGIEELATLSLLQQQLNAIDAIPDKLVRWLANKIENLVMVINQSYQSAIQVEPYWR